MTVDLIEERRRWVSVDAGVTGGSTTRFETARRHIIVARKNDDYSANAKSRMNDRQQAFASSVLSTGNLPEISDVA